MAICLEFGVNKYLINGSHSTSAFNMINLFVEGTNTAHTNDQTTQTLIRYQTFVISWDRTHNQLQRPPTTIPIRFLISIYHLPLGCKK